MNGMSGTDLLFYLVAILIGLVLHEFMHAFVGYKLGDRTAHEGGRLNLNPLAHIDPFMTVVLPVMTLLTFGFPVLAAKPVPFNPNMLKFDEFGAAMVAAAGPATNLVLAILAAAVGHATSASGLFAQFLAIFISLNVGLFIFNLVPIPPLDGSRVLYSFAPEAVQDFMDKIEPMGFFIVFGLVLLPTGFVSILTNINQMVLNVIL